MAVYKQQHPNCEVCGWTRHVHVHHLLPLSMGGTNDDANLVTLCANHHADAHAEMGAFIECEGRRGQLILTRYGVVRHLKDIDKDSDQYERHLRAARNQHWAAMTSDQRHAALQAALNQPVLSDQELMLLCDLRRGNIRIVPATEPQIAEAVIS